MQSSKRALLSNVKLRIADELQRYLRSGKPHPSTLVLAPSTAIDFTKLGRNEIGTISEQLLKHGYKHLEKCRVFGMRVLIDKDCPDFGFK